MDKIGIRTIVVNFEDEQLPYLSLVQGDAKTRGFDIVICDTDGKEIPPSDDYIVELVATGSNEPDKPYANRHTIKDGKYRVMIPTEALSESGFVFLQLVFYQKSTGAVIHTIEQKCPVYRSRGQEVVESNNLYVDITALRLGLERIDELDSRYESMLSEEKIRQDAEKKRNEQEANRIRDEKTRESNETIRKSQESSRKSAEDKRVTAEEQRKSNETQRIADENIRLEKEATRQSEETERQTAEEQRIADETIRQSNETTRKSQETARESAEDKRVSSETTRDDNEEIRKSNEIKREENEGTRIAQEKDRVIAEENRKAKFDGWDKTMEGIIPNATATKEGVVKISSLDSESEPYTAVSIGKLDEEKSNIVRNVNLLENKVLDNETQILTLDKEVSSVSLWDKTLAPGVKKPVTKEEQYAFYGEVSSADLISGYNLALKIGLSSGSSRNSHAGWLKFLYKGKILFVAKKKLRENLSWDDINSVGAVYGEKIIKIENLSYKVRLLRGIGEDVQPDPYIHQDKAAGDACYYSEWNNLFCPISEESPNRWQYPDNVAPYVDRLAKTYTNAELDMSGSSWCQEACGAGRSYRGGRGVSHAASTSSSRTTEGWRPVLELL